jgi:pyridoxine 5-phosphate synthase
LPILDATDPADATAFLKPLFLKPPEGAAHAHTLLLQVNHAHGISPGKPPDILIFSHLDTLEISHSIISRAVFCGLEHAVRGRRDVMKAS